MLASSSGAYDALIALHVLCAVAGFGAVAISGVYGGLARNPSNAAETSRYFSSRSVGEWLILPVPFLGLAALLVDHHAEELSDAWVLGGSALWVAAAALLFLVVRPAEKRLRRNEETAASGRVLMVASIASDVLFVAALALMVTQPG
ncbi:MAG TPA: hypothetical protein VFV02_11925 [Acidimicrobiales bacterium]|nr:hypothetical protein [Acidimicrobiales bacterium]